MSFNSLNDFLDCAVELLREKLGKSITVERQFPLKTKPLPLNKITVAIGTKGCSVKSKCIGNALIKNHFGKGFSAVIEAAVYVPLSMDSKLAYSTLESVLNILRDDGRFGITETEHGVLSSNRVTGSFELHCTLTSSLYETEE